jgi:hypothetical protein
MKKIIFIAVIAVMLSGAGAASAYQRGGTGTGIGVVFGYPGQVGLSIKINSFPVLGLWWYLGNQSGFAGTLDYWAINNGLGSNFYWYLGPGVYVDIYSTVGFGLRLPIGLQWFPGGSPFEIALEIAPRLALLPGMNFGFQGTIALRFHF